ncbi:MAG: rod-binding protein [Lachnospiraceae bacterium]|nr:rod-binding protein [Lachnospiraceae bacterium]
MDTSGISSLYTDYMTSLNTSGTQMSDTIKKTDYSEADEDELLEACKQFEAYFLEQVFKEMEKTVDCFKDEDSDPNNHLVDYFKGNAVQELAQTSTEIQGLGLAQTLYEQMKRNYNLT